MSTIRYNGEDIRTTDDYETAEVVARARVLALTGHYETLVIEADQPTGVAILIGPGIPLSAKVDNVEIFSAAVQTKVDEYMTQGISI